MAMSGDVLGKAIADLIIADDASAEDKARIEALWKSIAGQIVSHIQSAAQVTVAAGIPVSTAGSPTAQTGATTGPGSGTIA